MRGPEDEVRIRFELSGTVDMDWERIEEDPVWRMVQARHSTREAALSEYISRYLNNETLLANAPMTNGPASITGVQTFQVVLEKPLETA